VRETATEPVDEEGGTQPGQEGGNGHGRKKGEESDPYQGHQEYYQRLYYDKMKMQKRKECERWEGVE
jgi:hypothetical protein